MGIYIYMEKGIRLYEKSVVFFNGDGIVGGYHRSDFGEEEGVVYWYVWYTH